MNREINTLSIKGLLDKRFWVIIVFFMLTLPAYAVTNAFVVTGEVIDAVNNPLPGVNVVEKGTRNGTITDVDGKFELTLKDGNAILSFSYIGFTSIDVPVENKQNLRVKMREDVTQMDEVVVTGIYSRKKESFTGSSTTYTAKELKTIGNQNVLQSLKTMDPSFAIVETISLDPIRTVCRILTEG